MSRFLEIALPLAERGFRALPLISKQKRPLPIPGEMDRRKACEACANARGEMQLCELLPGRGGQQ